MSIRQALPSDVPDILAMIRELAEYERALDEVVATEDLLDAALFGPEPGVFALIAEAPDGTVVGFALWFRNFSTWLGQHGVYLEDLCVRHVAARDSARRCLSSSHASALIADTVDSSGGSWIGTSPLCSSTAASVLFPWMNGLCSV